MSPEHAQSPFLEPLILFLGSSPKEMQNAGKYVGAKILNSVLCILVNIWHNLNIQ